MRIIVLALLLAGAFVPRHAGEERLSRQVADDAGNTNAPLLFCIGMHVEPLPVHQNKTLFERQAADIRRVAAIAEKYGGRLTVQAQTPFTKVAAESGNKLFAELEQRGHEIALHFHEDAHLGRGSERLSVAEWVPVMKEEIVWLKKAGATRIRYWSGGNLYPGVLDAAAQAGLDVMSDHKNPRRQATDERLLGVNPWRPAGGPTADDVTAFARHDPQGKIVYLPDGKFSRVDHAGMRRSPELGGDWKYFDFLTEGLEDSLRAARPDRVNVFHITVHPGEFRGNPNEPFAVIEAWLREVVAPLVKAGKVRWATFSQMADEYIKREQTQSPPPRTFFAVHCEAHSANPRMWEALCRFVEMADRYEAKLTLMFNPQWAEFIVPDKERFERVKLWQKNGHEVAVHYHNIVHGDWNGHTNRAEKKNDRRYQGTVAEMMASLQKLAAPDTMLTMCMGPDARWDSLSEVEIDETDYPDGILYDVDGMNVGLTRLMKTKFRGRDLLHLKHHFFAPGHREEHLDKIKEEFRRAKPGEVLGVVTHEADFARSPEFIEKWFQFCRENKARIRTVRDIVKSYPADQIVEVKWVRQEPAQAKLLGELFARVRKFQEQLKVAKAERRDTSAAEEFDRQSRTAAGRGDTTEAERLLDKAIAALSQKKQVSADSRGFITFAVNTHDWPHLEESAATVLRLIGIFEKHKVRGDFYFTPQIVEHYAQKRPDVIERLKQSGMGISYHVRPPHPTNAGFEGRLRGLDDDALAQMLRDYETYRLDPITGDLQRDKPGGYSYVAQVFGRKPVVVSPQARDPRIRAAALKVYAEMGAKMVVAYHESGTKLEQPFEWIQGLLARPSDFSVTRLERDVFWWNTPNSDPVALLKRQLADWRGSRAPFITALIHENDFARTDGPGWSGIYYTGRGPSSRPKQPPFDLHAPDLSRPRTAESREKIWKAYEELVAYAAGNLRVVTSEDIAIMASLAPHR